VYPIGAFLFFMQKTMANPKILDLDYTNLVSIKDNVESRKILEVYKWKKPKKIFNPDKSISWGQTDEQYLIIKYYDKWSPKWSKSLYYPLDNIAQLWYNNTLTFEEFVEELKNSEIVVCDSLFFKN